MQLIFKIVLLALLNVSLTRASLLDAFKAGVGSLITKFTNGTRYVNITDPNGDVHLIDTSLTASELLDLATGYKADEQNVYYLFTRQNPSEGQKIVPNDTASLNSSYFDAEKNIVVIIHGWMNNASSDVNTVLTPAFLEAEDVNVIVVDWGAGGNIYNYLVAVINDITSGQAVARFMNWIFEETGATAKQCHVVGHSLGAHQAGIVGRNVNGNFSYITACDPAGPVWEGNVYRLQSTDADYTEVIHSNAFLAGYPQSIGDVDFYPNGGVLMPGCNISISCDHARSFNYLAESVVSGGFTGVECASSSEAFAGLCTLNGTLNMGGITPKTGSTGVYYLKTNAESRYSLD